MLKLSKIKTFITNYHGAIFGFILLSFAFDFIDKIEIFHGLGIVKLNRILKAIFLAYVFMFILSHIRYVYRNLKGLLAIIIVLSIIYLLKNNFSELYFIEYIRYIFVLLTLPLLHYTYVNKDQELLKKVYKLFKWLIIINAILILIGVLFDVLIFKTYQHGRFGFNGFLLSQGFTPFFYLCATTIFWVFKDKKMLLLLLLLCVLSGVKGVYFGEFLLLSLLVVFNQKFNKSFKINALALLLITFVGLLVGLWLMPTFREVFESNGLLAAISSFRTDNTIRVYNEINSDNYSIIIGALETKSIRLEMQISDIILFFGIIGLLAYLTFLYLLNKSLIKNTVAKAFFITMLTLSVLSGNLLYIPLSSILMFLVLMSLYNSKSIK